MLLACQGGHRAATGPTNKMRAVSCQPACLGCSPGMALCIGLDLCLGRTKKLCFGSCRQNADCMDI
jgi:hypothetical protein